jgi:porin
MSSWPDATFGGRVRVRPVPELYVQAGLYEVNQNTYTYPQFRSGFDWSGAGDSGVEVPVEVGYTPHFGPDRLPGHYKIGFGYDSSRYRQWAHDPFGPGAPLSGVAAKRSTGKTTAWALVDQMLFRNGPGEDDGVIVLGAYAHGDPATSSYADQFTFGLLDHGFWRARPADTVGVLFTYQSVSGALGKEQALDAEFGLPFANGATGIQTHEEVLEVTYDIHVAPGVNFQPEFQYVFRPNAQANLRDAAVFGFKAHVNF